ncbi:hypothetical protein PSJ8397_02402 [Pseudooctadecabacter jejudonensis]|uniref:Uncharacterized protein n=1 Tax=Pseudooctadecabacter jejudonensis TaxID=1391910 RepID=A0A1Y5SVA7_9RHOB|nr:hypothetical protein PSJ8397_02402 [Pseudooctadecabacter jejudonensis]
MPQFRLNINELFTLRATSLSLCARKVETLREIASFLNKISDLIKHSTANAAYCFPKVNNRETRQN